MNSTDRIEILAMRHIQNRGNVKAVTRVRIGIIVIDDIKIIVASLGSRPFVSMPSRKNGDGWSPVVSILSPTLEQAVSNDVLAAWRRGGAG
ncbi:hypothetical protein BH10CHL1_BH10CHL1_47790 [soil metagenome]